MEDKACWLDGFCPFLLHDLVNVLIAPEKLACKNRL
jgi:hypothetical protein